MWYISICGKWWWREQTSFPCCTCEICSLFLRWCIQGGQHLKSFLCQCHLFLLDYDAQSQQTNDIGSIFVVTLGYSLSLFWLSEDAYQHHWKNGSCNKIDLHFISFFPQFLSILESIFMWQLAFQIKINKCWIHISHTPLKTNISPKNLMLRFHESSCWNGLFSSQVDPQPFAACMAGWVSSRSLRRRIHWKRSGGASFCQKTVETWKVLSLSTSFCLNWRELIESSYTFCYQFGETWDIWDLVTWNSWLTNNCSEKEPSTIFWCFLLAQEVEHFIDPSVVTVEKPQAPNLGHVFLGMQWYQCGYK